MKTIAPMCRFAMSILKAAGQCVDRPTGMTREEMRSATSGTAASRCLKLRASMFEHK
jgi:hypothetical protein